MQQDNPILQELKYILPTKTKFIGFFGGNLPLWSLSIEWWLYMFFGILYFNKNDKLSKAEKIIFSLSIPFVIGFAIIKGRASWGLTYIWFSGVFVNYLLHNSSLLPKVNLSQIIFFICLTSFTFIVNTRLSIIPFIILFYLCLKYFQEKEASKIFQIIFKILKLPSDISFSVYIIHYPILLFLLPLIPNKILFVICSYVISNLFSCLIFIYFESKHKQLAYFIKNKF